MNEEIKDLENPTAVDVAEALPSVADARPADQCGNKEAPAPTDAADPADSATDSAAPAASDTVAGTDPFDSAELSALRAELTRLREDLTRKQEVTLRLGRECAEFRDLYPDVPLSAIPDEAWDAVRSGVPLSAAFALAERKRARLEETAKESNLRNRSRSAGEVSQETSGYFSYDEVKNMSRTEIRENYNNILLSMQKWH